MFLYNYSYYSYNFVRLLEEFNKPNSFRLIQFYLCMDKTIYSFCVRPVFHHSLLVLPISANPYCSSILPILSIVTGNFNKKWPTSELLFQEAPPSMWWTGILWTGKIQIVFMLTASYTFFISNIQRRPRLNLQERRILSGKGIVSWSTWALIN